MYTYVIVEKDYDSNAFDYELLFNSIDTCIQSLLEKECSNYFPLLNVLISRENSGLFKH